jgi:hypothetical protein
MVSFVTSVGVVFTYLLCVPGGSGRLQGQTSPMQLTRHSAELQGRIKDEEAQHATPERVAALWLALAYSYSDQFDSGPTEDAFARIAIVA